MFKRIKHWIVEKKQQFIKFLKEKGLLWTEISAEKAKMLSLFGVESTKEDVLYAIIKDICESIRYKATKHSQCLILELTDDLQCFQDEIVQHFKEKGFNVQIINKDLLQSEIDLLYINWTL